MLKKWGPLLLLALTGVAIILVPWSEITLTPQNTIEASPEWRLLEQELAHELEEYLLHLCNARTHVMVHLAALEYNEYWQQGSNTNRSSTEEDGNSGSRSSTESSNSFSVQTMRVGGNETPVLVRRWMPMISGIAIIIERQSDPILTDQVVRSVSTLYQMGSHKISVQYSR